MKKNSFKFLILIMSIILLTGCVKMDVSMEIKNDKSMDLSIIMAYDKGLQESLEEYKTSSDEKKITEYEKKGFYVQKYDENGKSGYKITKQIKNIDDYSTESVLEKSEMTEALTGDKQYMFTIKKSFFMDTYSASCDFSNISDIGDSDSLIGEYDENCIYGYGGSVTAVHCSYGFGEDTIVNQEENKKNYTAYVEEMKRQDEQIKNSLDIKFNLKLPYGANSSNATSKTNGGKNLVWDLSKVSEVNFSFNMYNVKNIAIVGGIGLVVLIIIIATIVFNMNNKRNTPTKHVDKSFQPSFMGGDPYTMVTSSNSSVNDISQNLNIDVQQQAPNTFISPEVQNMNVEPQITNTFINENSQSQVAQLQDSQSSIVIPPMQQQNVTNNQNNRDI